MKGPEKYVVNKELEHDDKTYRPGEGIDLEGVNADYLLSKGMIAKQVEAKPKTKEQQA